MISYLNPVPSLPTPLGPHKVGSSEWEIPISEISPSSQPPDPSISTLKFRLYYPTPQSSPSTSIKWLPSPQRQWVEAYASFLGASARLSSIISILPSLLNFTTISASPDSSLLPRTGLSKYPVVVFSHGLGGNFNAYSSVCASLASFGIVCAAPEHRDGSAPVSFIRTSTEETTSIPYQKLSHSPTPEVLNARNAQLRIRLWELEQLSTVLTSLNAGKTWSNLAASKVDGSSCPSLKDALDLRPGHITWAGHSFGAATTVQFVKSVYYHQHVPSLKGTEYENDLDWRPLYTPAENGELVQQITPESPVVLLDLWTMPLRGEATKWLWERPLPCYARDDTASENRSSNVVAIISAEFHKYADLLNRTKAALSQQPAAKIAELDQTKSSSPSPADQTPAVDIVSPASSASTSANQSRTSSPSPAASSTTSFSESVSPPQDLSSPNAKPTTGTPASLYLIPNSAHLSQSDFGLLFPNLTRYVMKAQDPQKTIELNVRAILAVMRGRGLNVEPFAEGGVESDQHDRILSEDGLEQRFVRLSLS